MKILPIMVLILLVVVNSVYAEEITGYKDTSTTIVTACIRNSKLIDTAQVNISIYDSGNNKIVDNQIMSSNTDGKYYYSHTFYSTGWYSTKETCDFGDYLADASTKIHIIDFPTTLVNTNNTFINILNNLSTTIQQNNNITYQVEQMQSQIVAIQNTLLGINGTVNNGSIITDLNNSLSGLIVAQTEKPPYLDSISVIIVVLLILLILTIWVRNAPYFLVVGLAYLTGGAYIGIDKSAFLGMVLGFVGLMYLIGAGLKGKE